MINGEQFFFIVGQIRSIFLHFWSNNFSGHTAPLCGNVTRARAQLDFGGTQKVRVGHELYHHLKDWQDEVRVTR
jgi:hypothetical protein